MKQALSVGYFILPIGVLLVVLLFHSISSHRSNQVKLNVLTDELNQVNTIASRMEGRLTAIFKSGSSLQSTMDTLARQMNTKLDALGNYQTLIGDKLDTHGAGQRELSAKIESQAELNTHLHDDIKDTRHSLNAKLDAIDEKAAVLKEAVEKPRAGESEGGGGGVNTMIELPNGAHLPAPWSVNNSIVSLGSYYLFRLTTDGFIKFRHANIKHVQIYVGDVNASRLSPLLANDPDLFIFVISPFEKRAHFASDKSQRLTLIPAGLWHTTGYRSFRKGTGTLKITVFRLENLLQLLPTGIHIQLLSLGAGHDFMDILTAGHFIPNLPRVIMQLQDLPHSHLLKANKQVANTTLATHKLRQKGLHLMCCSCRAARTFDVECYFSRKGYTNFTANWLPEWHMTSAQADKNRECNVAYDRETGMQLPLNKRNKMWTVPMCR